MSHNKINESGIKELQNDDVRALEIELEDLAERHFVRDGHVYFDVSEREMMDEKFNHAEDTLQKISGTDAEKLRAFHEDADRHSVPNEPETAWEMDQGARQSEHEIRTMLVMNHMQILGHLMEKNGSKSLLPLTFDENLKPERGSILKEKDLDDK